MKSKWILNICLNLLHLKQMQYGECNIFLVLPKYNSMQIQLNFNIGTVNAVQKKFKLSLKSSLLTTILQ